MSRIDKYADWLVDNQDKKGTPDFETVVNAYKELRAQESDTLVDDVFKLQEVPEDAPIETDFLDEIEEGIKGIGGGAVNILESAALGAITPFGEDTESYLREGIQSVGGAAKSLFEADKGSEDLVGRKFGEALGSYAGILGAAAIPGVGLPAAAALAVGAGAGEASERARAKGATEGERGLASLLGAGVGATELISPLRIVRAFNKGVGEEVTNTIFDKGKRILREAGIEGAQEFLAGVGQNLIEQNIYNPEQGTFAGSGEALGYGAGVGGFVQAAMEIIAPYRARGKTPDSTPEETKLLEDQRRLQLEDQRPNIDYGPELREDQTQGELFPDPVKNIEGDPNVVEPESKVTDPDQQPVTKEYEKQEAQKYIELAKEDFVKQGNQNPTALELSDKARELQIADLTRTEAKQDSAQPDMIDKLETTQTKELIDADETTELEAMLARDEAAAKKEQVRKQDQIAESETETITGQLNTQQQKTTEAKRTAILQGIIENSVVDDTLANNFSKELARQGISNTTPTAAELNTINRAIDFDRAEKPVLEETKAKEFQVVDGKRLPRTEIPSLEKEVTPKTPEIQRLSATASQDVAPAPVAEPVDKITTEETPANPVLERAYKKMSAIGGEKLTDEEISELTKVDPYKRTEEQKVGIKKLQDEIALASAARPSTTTQTDALTGDTKPTPEKKLSRGTRRDAGPKDPVEKIGKTLGFATKTPKTKIKKQISKQTDTKALTERFEKQQEENKRKVIAKEKVRSAEELRKEGVSKPTAEQVDVKTKDRKAKTQSKKATKVNIDTAIKDIKLTEKQKINEKQLATFVQEDTTQKDKEKTNVVKPSPERVAADNIEFYMKEFPNQDSTTQLSMNELEVVLDLVSNPPSSSDITTPSRDKTGRAAAYIYFSKQGNPRDVLDVVAHDVFFAPKEVVSSDYESKASREYFFNANEQTAMLARKWIDANLNKSQVKIEEGETTYKLDFTNVDFENNKLNIGKLKKLGYTDKELKKMMPTLEGSGKIQPTKKEITTPNVTFVPANKTLYNAIQREANNYLATESNETLVSLGVSRRGDTFKADTLKTVQEQREATAPKAVIYNTNEVVSGVLPPSAKNPTPEIKGIVFVKDGKEVFGPFPENVNHPLKDKDLKDYKFLETSAVNGLDIPIHPVIRSLLTQGKLHEALVALGNSATNKRVAQISRALSKVSGTTKVKVVNNLTADNSGKEVSGKFDPKTNTIFLDADTGINSHVILHEMTHAATTEMLANKSSQEVKKLNVLFNSVKDMLDTAYGSQNIDEFVAEAFSNPEFQQKLAGMNYNNTNGLQTFFNTIGNFVRKLLGMQAKNINTALNESDQLIQNILSPAPESRNAGELLMLRGKERIEKVGEYISNIYNETKSGEGKQQFQNRLSRFMRGKTFKKLKYWTLRSLPSKAVADQLAELNKDAIKKLKVDLNNATTAAEKTAIEVKLKTLRSNTAMQLQDAITTLEGDLAKADTEVEATLKKLEPWVAKAKKENKLETWNDVIHDSTIEGVDPTVNESVYKDDPAKLATHKQLKSKLYGLGGDAVRSYVTLRNAYETQFESLKSVIEARMSEMTDQATFSKFKKDVFEKMFDKSTIRPYFPLMRKGDYWLRYEIPITQSDGTTTNELVVEAFENVKGRDIRIAELAKGKEAEKITEYTNVTAKSFGNVPPTSFVGEVLQILKQSKVDEKTQDNIINLFIDVLPESSFAKGFKKRQGILGAKKEAYDVFREKGFDIGRQTARMLNGAKISKLQKKLKEETESLKYDEGGESRNMVEQEMQTRGDFARNPPPDHIASMANRLAFIGTIGFNVSSAVVNFSQIPLMFYPILGGRYGLKEANSAIGTASVLFTGSGLSRKMKALDGENVDAKGSVSIDNYFEADGESLVLRKDLEIELNKTGKGRKKIEQLNKIIPLIKQAQKDGMLNRSIFYDTLGVETAGKTRNAWDKINAWSAWTFHHMERMNRQVALVASYNLEIDRLNTNPTSKEKDLSTIEKQELAAKNAIYLTTDMNGGATLSTTSGIAQEGVGRVAMMYKGYGIQMYYTMFKTARDAIRRSSDPDLTAAENKELRSAARKQVGGILLSSALLAGVQGMPLVGIGLALWNIGLDDDEEDAETQLRKFIGERQYKGPINYYGGVDIASRIGLSNLLFRTNPYTDPDASLVARLGEFVAGPAGSMANQVYRGVQELQEGELERAGMSFVPAAMRNMYKAAIKYPTEGGILTRRGDVIYDDLNAWETGAQFFGFAPAEYTKTQEMNRITKTQDRDIVSQSTKLLKQYYVAMRMGGDTQDILEDIMEYNRKYPAVAISPSSIIRSMRMHMRTSLLMDKGITLSPKMRAYLLAQRNEWSPSSLYDED